MRGRGVDRGAVVVALLSGCAGPATQIVEDPRDLDEASGAPRVTEVRDLGGGDVPANGQLRPVPGDGVAVIGETLWIRGKELGRQPTVEIGGRPAAVLSRTLDGGILMRVPIGTAAGAQPLVVRQERGRAERTVQIRRLAAVIPPEGGRVLWAEVGDGAPVVAGATDVPHARAVRFSADGRAAYVLAGRSTLAVIEVPAAGGPAVVAGLDVGPEPARELLAAPGAHRLLVLRAEDAVTIDTSTPLRLGRGTPRPLPPTVRAGGVRRAALSPDGELVAVAVGERNRVVLLRAARLEASQAAIVGDVALEPEVRAPVLADLAFSPDGETLWVVSGDTPDSRELGPQPTRVYAVRLKRESKTDVKMELARTVTLPNAGAPQALETGRTPPLPSGAAVRLPPEKATVFLAARAAGSGRGALFALGAEDAAAELFAAGADALVAAAGVTPDGRWLLGAVLGKDGAIELASARADGRPGAPRAVSMGRTNTARVATADLRIQP